MDEPKKASAATTPPDPAGGGDLAQLQAARREITELRAALASARAREHSLIDELQHRVRNMLATIHLLYRRTWDSSDNPDQFAEHFAGRLTAVTRYQSQLDIAGTGGIEIEDIIRDELLETGRLDRPGCSISGPPIRLRQKSAELMSLAIHELATNAIKFGALSRSGNLAVEWSREETPAGPWMRFRWTETGIAVAAAAPRPSGFGRELIEKALPYQLGAQTAFHLRPGGVECEIALPLGPESDDRPVQPGDLSDPLSG